MRFGLQMIFQNPGGQQSDHQVVSEEVKLGVLAESLGFDELWPVEHHFHDYAACPDNIQLLSFLAAKTSTIRLATGAVILPWNDPLRVVEKIILLDHLCDGRAVLGMGRGLARREYEGFGIPMEESRDRFDEASTMILEALETGVIQFDGRYYKQARTEIRPAPYASFKGRVSCVAMSPDSVLQAARLGANMVVFSNGADEEVAKTVATYRQEYARHHPGTPPPPRFADFMVCDEDSERAAELAERYISAYFVAVMNHYELMSEHFKGSRSYKSYGDAVDLLREIGLEDAAKAYVSVQAAGTPDQIIDRLRQRRRIVGDFDLNVCARFSGIPLETAENTMRLFSEKVMPVLRQDGVTAAAG